MAKQSKWKNSKQYKHFENLPKYNLRTINRCLKKTGLKPGMKACDIGAGAGTDALLSGLLTGESGKVYGLDMTRAMREKLQNNIEKMGLENVFTLTGNAEEIPLEEARLQEAYSEAKEED